ncbi:protein translocase subunit SecF [Vibrio sp. Of7-15]|uniref:protein translocase subunit SecF n=1 Tax=Vibrio sp. Of7-15 TaxID=2724879 RepID=UPI001EF2811F|nr:protein translocase subunit SecF [Vibrio sp. Of7-15]
MTMNIKQHIRTIRYFTSGLSVALMLVSVIFLGWKGLNFGLDFTGGMVTEVKVDQNLTRPDLAQVLSQELGDEISITQSSEQGRWVIRYALPEQGDSVVDIATLLHGVSEQVTVVSNSMVGAQVGQELVDQGGLALLMCMLTILGYLCFRFEWRLASGSLLALIHDVVLVLGFFAATQLEFNLTVFAAILAILGYSLNDSIIIADRIRELLVAKPTAYIKDINDQAIMATFSRTMVTSGTTLITVGALWLMGGDALLGFSTAMFIGILSGTWSSISVGTVLPEWLQLEPKHYLPVEVDSAP